MKVLLTAINAKYIHSNLAVYSLSKYVSDRGIDTDIAEYTINQNIDEILSDIYLRKPDILAFSCYLWNIEYVSNLITEIKKILPKVIIWLGGPEVSYNSKEVLTDYPFVKGIVCGEGEESLRQVLSHYISGDVKLEEISGVSFYNDKGEIITNPITQIMDLSNAPFVYDNMKQFEHKIIYYESSRGCPFNCSYCLSSVDKRLRFRNIDLVKEELLKLIEAEVPQVKFVDRTFNCKHDHAYDIWKFINDNDKGITNFHFEVSADFLNEKELELMKTMRPGLIQLEIGVQSTNPDTIKEIHRTMNFEKVSENVNKIHSWGNIHQHLDLIAGLPFEDYESFKNSFNDVYTLCPEQLQMGFLKVLKGSYMYDHVKDYELLYQDRPPFEVLSTKWLPYSDVIRLKQIEDMVEVHYNSGQFECTIKELEKSFDNAFDMYEKLALFYEKKGYDKVNHSRISRYEILYDFIKEYADNNVEDLRQLLVIDLYLRDNVKNRPDFAGELTVSKDETSRIYELESEEHKYLEGYDSYDKRQIRKMTHLERYKDKILLFDYKNRNILNNQAKVIVVDNNVSCKK